MNKRVIERFLRPVCLNGLSRSLCNGVLMLLFVFAPFCVTAAASPQPSVSVTPSSPVDCADFLAQINKKPAFVEFARCEKITQHGTPALRATYRVAGSHASAVEARLIANARMPRLRYLCCGWESLPRRPRDQARVGVYTHKEQRYEITMTSGESTVKQRARWPEIPFFEVKVTTFLDTP